VASSKKFVEATDHSTLKKKVHPPQSVVISQYTFWNFSPQRLK